MHKVLHIFGSMKRGGLQIRSLALLKGIESCFENAVLTLDGDIELVRTSKLQVEIVEPAKSKVSLASPIWLSQTIRRVRPSLIVTYGWGAFDGIIGGKLAGVGPIIHNECSLVDVRLRQILARRLLLNRIYKTLVPSASLLGVALKRYKIRAEKLQWIPNGVDTEKFRPRPATSIRSNLGLKEGNIVFGTVARLAKEKNLQFLLQSYAAAGLPDARLVIVGDGPCRAELEKTSKDLGISGQVNFVGETSRAELYLAAFDVFVMSSDTEQMPMALLEAMATGLPVISTAVGDISEVLGGLDIQVVSRPNELQYCQSLRKMAQDSLLRTELGRKNRLRCMALYSVERFIQDCRRVYEDALSGTRVVGRALSA